MRVIIAGPNEAELSRTAYPSFAASGFDVSVVTKDPQQVVDLSLAFGGDVVVVVQAELWTTPEEAAVALRPLLSPVVVILPAWWGGNKDLFQDWVVAGFVAPVAWHRVAADVKTRIGGSQQAQLAEAGGELAQVLPLSNVELPSSDAESPASSSHSTPVPPPLLGEYEKRLVAFWSGPAGGTGRTTLALALAMVGAERGLDVALLALAEPALSAYLKLPRSPNVAAFLSEGKTIASIERTVVWQVPYADQAQLHVLLGPARPRDGVVDTGVVGAVVEAARAAHDLVVLDLPPLTAGDNAWSLAPLEQATDVVLVGAPTSAGVVAIVEALATLRDLGAPGKVSLVMNHRFPNAPLSARDFCGGVENLWGGAPSMASIVQFCAGLPQATEAGAPLDAEGIEEPMLTLAEAAAGIPRPKAAEEGQEQPVRQSGSGDGAANERRKPRRLPQLGQLITVEVTE